MKKLLPLLLSMALVLSLTACGGENTSSGGNGSSRPSSQLSGPSAQASETPSPQTPSGSEPSAEATLPAAGTCGILIAYFSWSGNTQQMAQISKPKRAAPCLKLNLPPRTQTITTSSSTLHSRSRRTTHGRSWPIQWKTRTATTSYLWDTLKWSRVISVYSGVLRGGRRANRYRKHNRKKKCV